VDIYHCINVVDTIALSAIGNQAVSDAGESLIDFKKTPAFKNDVLRSKQSSEFLQFSLLTL
jgi:hypothetical protein